jgi:hypothetical protein
LVGHLYQEVSFWELSKTNNFPIYVFLTIITKEVLRRIVALTNFVGMIATLVARR